MALPFPITVPAGTVIGRLQVPQAGDADAIPFATLASALPLLAVFGPVSNSLSGDVLLNNVSNYIDGPSVTAVPASGTWLATGTVTVVDTGGAVMKVKLWDGTTVIASTNISVSAITTGSPVSLSGFITAPAGNIRISVNDSSTVNGKILFNQSGNSKDSTITIMRVG